MRTTIDELTKIGGNEVRLFTALNMVMTAMIINGRVKKSL